MLDFASQVGRRLRAFFHCRSLPASPTPPNGFDNSRSRTRKSSRSAGVNNVPLPDSPPLAALVAQHRIDRLAEEALDDTGSDTIDVPEENPVEWTRETAQAAREANYVRFSYEDETDYTQGPVRMVDGNDGVVDCTALLLTLDFSKAVQAAIKAQRAFLATKTQSNKKIEALLQFQSTLQAQIASHKSRLTMPDLDADKKAAVEGELSDLELMLEEYALEQTSVRSNLEFQGDMLRKTQAKVTAALEEAWTAAQLLEPEAAAPEAPAPVYDLQTEYQAFQAKLRDAHDFPLTDAHPPAPLDTSRDHLQVAMTAEEAAAQEKVDRFHERLWQAWDALEDAQAAFDNREHERWQALQERRAAVQRGEPRDTDSETFDLRWLHHERGLTRGLLEAEEAYRALKAEGAAAGFDDDGGVEAGSADGDDGEQVGSDSGASGSDVEVIASVPSSRIARWLDGIPAPDEMVLPDAVDREDLDDAADEWDAAELDVGDSVSHFCDLEIEAARNPKKVKILEWQEEQHKMAAEFEWMRCE